MDLRWYQREAVDATWEYKRANPTKNPLIDLPTGSGKSLVNAELARTAVVDFGAQVICVTHRKELVEQNAAKLRALTDIPIGIYSAGLKSRDTEQPIILAGIQSVYSRAAEFGRRHLILVDEAHRIPETDDGIYHQFIRDISQWGKTTVIGLTATPYRLGSGMLYGDGQLFDDICYRASTERLIAEGFLSHLTNKPSETHYATENLHTRAGEFVAREAEDLFSDDTLRKQSCQEIVTKAAGRKSIIVFCTGIANAEKVETLLAEMTGEEVGIVTGETPSLLRETTLERFDRGLLRWLVNVDVLTTGFDSPRIDCVAILRATQSPGLFCQIVGRGLRLFPGKQDCLVLDFGGNLERHGPINSPAYGADPRKTKECPACQVRVHKAKQTCICGHIFTKECPECSVEQPMAIKVCACGYMFNFTECPKCAHKNPVGTEYCLECEHDMQTKLCPSCEVFIPKAQVLCECGFEFAPVVNHDAQADVESAVLVEPEQMTVNSWNVSRWSKRDNPEGKPDTLRVDYFVDSGDVTCISEWVCLNHEGWAGDKARQWFEQHCGEDLEYFSDSLGVDYVDAAIHLFHEQSMFMPARLTVVQNGRWYDILSREFVETGDVHPEELIEDDIPF